MPNRRLLSLFACVAAAVTFLVGQALADELVGRITAVNIDAKKLTVKEKDKDKDIEVSVTEETVVEKGKGKSGPIDLEKMQKQLEKSRKGLNVEITHDKGVASKIVYKGGMSKKKGEPKSGEGKPQ